VNLTSIDIFCHVIDNFGDAGVVYRFAKEFKKMNPQCNTRVFIDDLKTLHSIVPQINASESVQHFEEITFIDSSSLTSQDVEKLGVADILVEAFACYIPEPVMDVAVFKSKIIINLEYLSAEDWVEGYHLKESLLNKGTAKKFFFMPGLTTSTGGVIINTTIAESRERLQATRLNALKELLEKHIGSFPGDEESSLFGTVFSYERGFDNLLKNLTEIDKNVYLMIFGLKSHDSIRASLKRAGMNADNFSYVQYKNTHIVFLPFLSQQSYDSLLCCCDFNLVRGEYSLVRAICAAKPFLWNAYLQENRYQRVKVDAFLKNFQQYFDDSEVFIRYKELLEQYNDAEFEEKIQKTTENFNYFFRDLNKIEHATQKMSYFIEENCNLVKKFSDFLREFNN
jgi:uncharacterized repeat protein (TIGR03837 family)